jgi:hypothetical protein
MSEAQFYEKQKFTQTAVQIILYTVWAGFLVLSIFLFASSEIGLLPAFLLFAFVSVFVLVFKSQKLETRISADAICYRFFPLQWRFRVIRKQDIEEMRIVSFDPLGDYGGWGIRIGRKGIAYTVKGTMGLSIRMIKKKAILIGTSRPGQLSLFLRSQEYCLGEEEP